MKQTIKIIEIDTNKPFSLQECAKEHGMDLSLGQKPHLAIDGDNPYLFLVSFGNYIYDTNLFNSSRFKLEITNEAINQRPDNEAKQVR